MIIARSDYPIEGALCEKISQFCDVELDYVIPVVTAVSLYEVPLLLEAHGVGEKILEYFDLKPRRKPDWTDWERIITAEKNPTHYIKIALVGKYVELHDAYMSVKEALKHASLNLNASIEILWVHSGKLEENIGWDLIQSADGILVPGGFGHRGIEGKIDAITYARKNKIPYLGLCLGMQLMVIEFARSILNHPEANSTEFSENTPYPVIDLMLDQKNITDKGGTMRLGLYPCIIKKDTLAFSAYNQDYIEERHRHRYEVNNKYREELEKGGMIFSGQSPNGILAEIAEISEHPFMVASQFHPEFLSRPNRPHPLFTEFIKAAITRIT